MDEGTRMSRQDPALTDLAEELGGDLPAGLASLPRETIAGLLVAIDEARQRQSDQLEASVDEISRLLPRPTRFLFRRAVRG